MSRPRVHVPEPKPGQSAVDASPLALQPELLDAFNRLYGTLWSRGVLDAVIKETARLRNANTVNCVYCKNVRFSTAAEQGLDEDQVAVIAALGDGEALSEKQQLVLRYTDTFLHNPSGLDEELKAAMSAAFSPEELVELTAGLALFMGFSKIAVSLGGMPDSLPVMQVPTPE